MTEKIGPVKNPLTVIAIFAGVAETAGTVVMPFIEPSIQGLYVWFIMLFPAVLVILFFTTLNLNPKVLYAPSDYEDEENFVDMLSSPSASERTSKLKDELEESSSNGEVPSAEETAENSEEDGGRSRVRSRIADSPQVLGLLAEELALAKVEKEIGAEVKREAQISVGGSKFLFDGIVSKGKSNIGLEVKYFSGDVSWGTIERSLRRIEDVYRKMSRSAQQSFEMFLAVVVEGHLDDERKEVMKMYRRNANKYSFPFSIEVYALSDLEDEFGLVE